MKKNVNRVLAASAAVVVLAVAAAFVWIEAGPRAHLPPSPTRKRSAWLTRLDT